MTLKKCLEKWEMTSLKINVKFLDMEWCPQTADQDAAWELYIELLTRTATQPLMQREGDEAAALASVFSIFGTTRSIIKKYGRDCGEFTKIAIVVLNQVIRPFTSKWHKLSMEGAFKEAASCEAFRYELLKLQELLRIYTRMLADLAEVEDLSGLEG